LTATRWVVHSPHYSVCLQQQRKQVAAGRTDATPPAAPTTTANELKARKHNAALICLARRRSDVIYAMLRDRRLVALDEEPMRDALIAAVETLPDSVQRRSAHTNIGCVTRRRAQRRRNPGPTGAAGCNRQQPPASTTVKTREEKNTLTKILPDLE